MKVPDVQIFVRHSADCAYRGDESYRKCKCRKHLRWVADDVHGRPKQFRKAAKTRAWSVAESLRDEIRAGYADGKPVAKLDTRQTIAEIGALFLTSKKNTGESGVASMAKHKMGIDRFVKFMEQRGVTFPSQITDAHLEAYRATWLELYAASITRAQVQNRLLEFFRFCLSKRFVDFLPTLSKIKVDHIQTQPLDRGEYEKLLAGCKTLAHGRKIAGVAAVMRWSGLSIADAACLKRTSIQEKQGAFRIVTVRKKTSVPVSNRIPAPVAKELLTVANGNPEFVFWNRKSGNEVTCAHHFGAWLKQAAAVAGIEHFHSHRLRDTFAVRLLEAGVPMEAVSKALGHKSISTTERYYAPWNKTRQDRLDSEIMKSW